MVPASTDRKILDTKTGITITITKTNAPATRYIDGMDGGGV
jgi:hypothetical protein